MENKKGIFIVIDGIDGSGKATQLEKLVTRCKVEGVNVTTFDFPQYGKPSAYFVEQYLNGKYSSAANEETGGLFAVNDIGSVGPYAASLFFALDRFDSSRDIRQKIIEGRVVISNRYTSSNLGHQGAKITKKSERLKYIRWATDLEFTILGIPRPTKTILLHLPAAVASTLVDQKASRAYIGGKKKDLHEKNLEHLKRAEEVYQEIASVAPEEYSIVECVEHSRLLSVDEIHERIWAIVKPLLMLSSHNL